MSELMKKYFGIVVGVALIVGSYWAAATGPDQMGDGGVLGFWHFMVSFLAGIGGVGALLVSVMFNLIEDI